jgi:hypothetical protein
MQLSDYVGRDLVVLIPRLDPKVERKVRLHGAEAGGIWIESQQLTNELLSRIGVSIAPKTMIFFFPYAELVYAMTSIDQPALNETTLGV